MSHLSFQAYWDEGRFVLRRALLTAPSEQADPTLAKERSSDTLGCRGSPWFLGSPGLLAIFRVNKAVLKLTALWLFLARPRGSFEYWRTQPLEFMPFARLKSWQVQKLMPSSISLVSNTISTLIHSQVEWIVYWPRMEALLCWSYSSSSGLKHLQLWKQDKRILNCTSSVNFPCLEKLMSTHHVILNLYNKSWTWKK